MKIETSRFGVIDVQEEDILEFPDGLPGFDEEKRFVLICPEDLEPLCFLQSVRNGELAFIVTNPFPFYPDYEFELSDEVAEQLSIHDPFDVAVYVIISATEGLEQATANLLGPILVNVRERMGKQIILHRSPYKTKHPLFRSGEERSEVSHARTQPQNG
jgi:flagellar assembly factor FliW